MQVKEKQAKKLQIKLKTLLLSCIIYINTETYWEPRHTKEGFCKNSFGISVVTNFAQKLYLRNLNRYIYICIDHVYIYIDHVHTECHCLKLHLMFNQALGPDLVVKFPLALRAKKGQWCNKLLDCETGVGHH